MYKRNTICRICASPIEPEYRSAHSLCPVCFTAAIRDDRTSITFTVEEFPAVPEGCVREWDEDGTYVDVRVEGCSSCHGNGYISDGGDCVTQCEEPGCSYWASREEDAAMKCRYCGAEAPAGVCDNCDAKDQIEAEDEPSMFPKDETGPLNWAVRVDESVNRLASGFAPTMLEVDLMMSIEAEIEAGPIPASEGATDQGNEDWVARTIEHLKATGFLPADAQLVRQG